MGLDAIDEMNGRISKGIKKYRRYKDVLVGFDTTVISSNSNQRRFHGKRFMKGGKNYRRFKHSIIQLPFPSKNLS